MKRKRSIQFLREEKELYGSDAVQEPGITDINNVRH